MDEIQVNNEPSAKRLFLVALIISLSLSALIAIFVFIFGEFNETEVKLLFTTLAIGGYSLAGLCSSVLYDKKKYLPLSYLGFALSFLGFVFTTLAIWNELNFYFAFRGLFAFMVLAISVSHVSLLLNMTPKNDLVRGISNATVTMISLVALLLLILIFSEFDIDTEFFYRILGVVAVLDVLGTILTPILNRK